MAKFGRGFRGLGPDAMRDDGPAIMAATESCVDPHSSRTVETCDRAFPAWIWGRLAARIDRNLAGHNGAAPAARIRVPDGRDCHRAFLAGYNHQGPLLAPLPRAAAFAGVRAGCRTCEHPFWSTDGLVVRVHLLGANASGDDDSSVARPRDGMCINDCDRRALWTDAAPSSPPFTYPRRNRSARALAARIIMPSSNGANMDALGGG